MTYKHKVFLRNGVPIELSTRDLPQFSDEGLLHFEKTGGEMVTFVVDSVAYWTTRRGE